MIIIAAVDDKMGMAFNKRRQSQDRVLKEYILSMAGASRLWMNQYSAKQFATAKGAGNLITDEDFLSKADAGDYCFVENLPVGPYQDKIEQIVLFRWNRAYPGDFHFDIDLTKDEWALSGSEEFAGSSHEKITKEVYSHVQG